MPCDGGAVFKGIEFVLCVVCLVYKRYTDNEAIRVFYHLEKLSREWPLLNNITWDENGALLADITFGAFAIITLGLLIAQLSGELRRVRRLVCFYLVLGCIMFLVVGGLCLAAVDQVPHHLVDNAIVLGVLSILTGLLFLLDLATTGNKKQSTTTPAQDKKPYKVASAPKPVDIKKVEDKKEATKETDDAKAKKNTGNGVLKELRSSFKKKKTVEDLDGRGVVVEKNEREKVVEFEPDSSDKVDTNRLEQTGDEFRQYGRRKMDNRGFARAASDDSGRFSSERFRSDFMDAERDRWLDRETDHSGARHVSDVVDEGRRSRPASMLEVELDEHYLRPKDYYIEKRVKEERDYYVEKKVGKEERRGGRDVQDQRVTSSSRHDMSDDEYQQQLPSVSFLISERGRKVLPSLKSSPVERLNEVTSSASPGAGGKPRYYFNSARDPASGSSAPPSPHSPTTAGVSMAQDSLNPSYTPRTPGYVLHTASQWDEPPSNVSDRIQHWFKNRPPGKSP